MEIKATITRVYSISVEVDIDINEPKFKDKTPQEIGEIIQDDNQWIYDLSDDLFMNAEEDERDVDVLLSEEEQDRFDIYENGKQIWGGSL